MPIGDIIPEIAIILTAVLILLGATFSGREHQWLGAPAALVGLLIAAIFCFAQTGEMRLTFNGIWALDGPSVWARLFIIFVTAFTVLMSPRWFETDRRHGEFYSLLLLSALGAMVLAGAADLLQLVMGVLLSSVTGYTLAAYHRDWPLSVEAGMKYFLVGALANAVLVTGVMLLFGILGTSAYEGISAALKDIRPSPLMIGGTALVVIGIAFKLAAVPAHSWMPDVAEGAPVPAAAFLTVAPKIGAAVALARLVSLFPPDVMPLRPLVAVIAVATMTLGNLAALWQDDVRRLIGWSSVSQSGYALMAVSVIGLSPSAAPALLVFLAGYAAANMAAFSVVAHLRGRTEIGAYAGLFSLHPLVALTLVIALLSLVGIPPLSGFFGKLTLFLTVVDGGYAWLAAVAVANTVISLFYYLRIIAPMTFSPAKGDAAVLGGWTALAAGIGLAVVIGFGIIARPLFDALESISLLP